MKNKDNVLRIWDFLICLNLKIQKKLKESVDEVLKFREINYEGNYIEYVIISIL